MAMLRSLAAVVVVASLAGCNKNNEPPPPTSGSPTAKPESGPSHSHRHPSMGGQMSPEDEAQRRFGTLCANCHGMDGKANTPTAAQLTVKPRDYTNPAWQASVTDDELRLAILKGGGAVGKSNLMPGNPDLEGKPEVIEALVQIVRGFGKTGASGW
jgi:cytochrome c553